MSGLRQVALLAASVLILGAPAAHATWSIVAVDPQTGEVGLAAASCSIGVPRIAALVPGKGAIVSQAATSFTGREKARELVTEGADATRVLAVLEDNELYADWLTIGFPYLQYGVATLAAGNDSPVATGFVTGGSNPDWSGGVAGDTYSAQGNTLRSAAVIDETARAFDEATQNKSCPAPLAQRLLVALEAGRDAGGDVRCPAEAPALAAILMVARPGDGPDAPTINEVAPRRFSIAREVVHLVVPYYPDPDKPEPVAELRARYDAMNPVGECAVP